MFYWEFIDKLALEYITKIKISEKMKIFQIMHLVQHSTVPPYLLLPSKGKIR